MVFSSKVYYQCLFLLITRLNSSHQFVKNIGLDNIDICRDDVSRIYHLNENDTLITTAKSIDHLAPVHVKNCQIRVQPVSTSKSQLLRIVFESFYINNCDVKFTIDESRFQTLEEEVTTLTSLGCKDASPYILTTSEPSNTIRLNLTRQETLRDFNFRLNITAFKIVSGSGTSLSVGEKIGIAVICSVAGIIILILIYKTIRLRYEVKKDSRTTNSGVIQLHDTDTPTTNGAPSEGNEEQHPLVRVPIERTHTPDTADTENDHLTILPYETPVVERDSDHQTALSNEGMGSSITPANDGENVTVNDRENVTVNDGQNEHVNDSETVSQPADNVYTIASDEGELYPDSPPPYEEALSMALPESKTQRHSDDKRLVGDGRHVDDGRQSPVYQNLPTGTSRGNDDS